VLESARPGEQHLVDRRLRNLAGFGTQANA
jgi:hypothetical protein